MFTVELYAGIRRAVMVDGLSRREAAKRLGVHRNTITKMLQFSIPLILEPPTPLLRHQRLKIAVVSALHHARL